MKFKQYLKENSAVPTVKIPRYSMESQLVMGEAWQDLVRDDEYGEWVEYEDHLKAVEAAFEAGYDKRATEQAEDEAGEDL